jgi:hypothetical protein
MAQHVAYCMVVAQGTLAGCHRTPQSTTQDLPLLLSMHKFDQSCQAHLQCLLAHLAAAFTPHVRVESHQLCRGYTVAEPVLLVLCMACRVQLCACVQQPCLPLQCEAKPVGGCVFAAIANFSLLFGCLGLSDCLSPFQRHHSCPKPPVEAASATLTPFVQAVHHGIPWCLNGMFGQRTPSLVIEYMRCLSTAPHKHASAVCVTVCAGVTRTGWMGCMLGSRAKSADCSPQCHSEGVLQGRFGPHTSCSARVIGRMVLLTADTCTVVVLCTSAAGLMCVHGSRPVLQLHSDGVGSTRMCSVLLMLSKGGQVCQHAKQ